MNNLCIIDGEYAEFNDLNELIKQYTSKYQLKVTNSLDGSELYKTYEPVNSLNIANNITTCSNNTTITNDTTINSENLTHASSNATSSTTMVATTPQPNRYHDVNESNVKYTCYLLNDFDNSNKIFTKLEEIQVKHSTNNHRFLVYGVPVLRYCNMFNLVS